MGNMTYEELLIHLDDITDTKKECRWWSR